MYITYETLQHHVENEDGLCSKSSLHPITCFTPEHPRSGPVEIPNFKPTWLIRISDMEKVRGSDVQEPYYALSYSWNQSGDIYKNDSCEKYTRVDNGKHRIIYYRKKTTEKRNIRLITKTRLVKFEGLIQQICQDFNIRYIWYDQACIDQNNRDEKRREIKQMHKIYGNAQCTVALVPEFRITGRNLQQRGYTLPKCADPQKIVTSEWSKRAWTLEEAIVSKRLLFVGRDAHLWSYIYNRNHGDKCTNYTLGPMHAFFYDICTKPAKLSVSTVLWHARGRTSTKLHDRFFALANLYPGLTQVLSFDYKQSLLEVMLQFYSFLAQDDLSILCIGIPATDINHLAGDKTVQFQEQEDNLPTWTGFNCSHATRLLSDSHTFNAMAINWKVNGRFLYLTCNRIHVTIERRIYQYSKPFRCYEEVSETETQPHTSPYDRNSLVFIELGEHSLRKAHPSPDKRSSSKRVGLRATHFLPLAKDKDSNVWINTTVNPTRPYDVVLSLTDTGCNECIILSELEFRLKEFNDDSAEQMVMLMPVVRHDIDGYYRCIGTCTFCTGKTANNIRLVYPKLEKKETFIIK